MIDNAITQHLHNKWKTKLCNIQKDQHMYRNIKNIIGTNTLDKIPTLHINKSQINLNSPISNLTEILNTPFSIQTIQINNTTDKANIIAQYFERIPTKSIHGRPTLYT